MIHNNSHAVLESSELQRHSYSCTPVMISKLLQSLPALAILNQMSDAIILIDTIGNIEFMNNSAIKLMNTTVERTYGFKLASLFTLLDYSSLLPIPDPVNWLHSQNSTTPISHYIKLQRHDGTIITVDINVTALDNNAKQGKGMMLAIRDVSHYQAHLDNLAKAARYDDNTQLLRRPELERRLTRVLDSMRTGEHHALLFMDLDHFKLINDTAGHLVGDQALRKVANLFHSLVRERDTLARLGGDEFGLLLEHCPVQLAIERAKALQKTVVNNGFSANGHNFILDVSIGIAAFRSGHHSAKMVMEIADAACYNAKRNSGSGARICFTVIE